MKKRCIHLFGIDDRGRLEIAVTPEGEMKTTWEALLRAGFRMKDTGQLSTGPEVQMPSPLNQAAGRARGPHNGPE